MTREEAIEYWEQFNAEIDDLYDACSDADRDVLVKQREIVEYTISALRKQEPNDFPKLRECPFCGSNAEEAFLKRKKLFASMRFPYNTHYVYIRCKTCGATGKLCWTVENAIEAWNRRAGEEDKHEQTD